MTKKSTEINIEPKLKLEQSLIRWAGSKRKLLHKIIDLAPENFKRYLEPFCGSASLFFQLSPTSAILSDVNSELINAWTHIRDDKYIRDKLIAIQHSKENYYHFRSLDISKLTKQERAIRFLYLNRFCFNGVYRTNRSGNFNVPIGNRTGGFPDEGLFKQSRKKLKNAELVCCDYKKIFRDITSNDFIYIDPPYAKSDKFTGEYGLGCFNYLEFPFLVSELKRIDKMGAKFMLSYRACNEVQDILKPKFQVVHLKVHRHIAGFKDSWQKAQEIIVRNYG